MKPVFLLDIDTQRDFILPAGALYVPGAERMIPKLRSLFDLAKKRDIRILSSVDAHAGDDPEFTQFPPHCIRGTEGQRKIDETLLRRPLILENRTYDKNLLDAVKTHQQIIIEKQELNILSNPLAKKILRVLPDHAIIFGVATEYCVKQATLGLRKLGFKSAVVTDLIAAVDKDNGRRAIAEMHKAGAEFISLDILFGVFQ